MDEDTSEETVADVIEEFKAFLMDALGTHAYASYALLREHERLTLIPDGFPDGPETILSLGAGPPEEPFPPYTQWSISEVRNQLGSEGLLQRRLGQQLVAYIYTGWEHEYRKRLARAHGCKPTDIKVPLLGDLRLLRHDVLHHRGVATKENSGKCEVLGNWVEIGQPIAISSTQVNELWKLFPWADLETSPCIDGADPAADRDAEKSP